MAVTLTPEDVGKLGPEAQAQIKAAAPEKKAPEKKAAPAEKKAAPAKQPPVTKKAAASAKRPPAKRPPRKPPPSRMRRTAGKAAKNVGSYQLSRSQPYRSAVRSAPASSAKGIAGMVTGAALVGLFVFRGDTVGALANHMVQFWRGVIQLGAPH